MEEEKNFIYPYEMDGDFHKWSYCLFNVPGAPRLQLESCSVIMSHLESLGFVGPNVSHRSELIYDALGTSGGPWENGAWQKESDGRMPVHVTVPDKDISDYNDDDIAEMEQALNALKNARLAMDATATNVEGGEV